MVKDEKVEQVQIDRLKHMFDLQEAFCGRYVFPINPGKPVKPIHTRTQLSLAIAYACGVELNEFVAELPWKHWREYKNSEIKEDRILDEIVDVQHLVVELCLINGIDFETFYQGFIEKNRKNHERQEGEY